MIAGTTTTLDWLDFLIIFLLVVVALVISRRIP